MKTIQRAVIESYMEEMLMQWLWEIIIPPFSIVQHVRWREMNLPRDDDFVKWLDAMANLPEHNHSGDLI